MLLVLLYTPVKGQIPNSMYFMPGVPQSNRINPAIQPGSGFYLGFPLLSPLRIQFTSSSLSFSDVFYQPPGYDSLITPFHPMADKEDFLKNFDKVNYFMTNLGTPLASLGFRVRDNFFSFDVTTRMDGSFYYPRGIFELLINGVEDESTISLGGLGVDLNIFNEVALGWSRKDFILNNLDIGVRGKLLFGLANINTKKSVFDISTSRDSWNLNTEFQINAAGPSFVQFNNNIDEGFPVIIDDSYFSTPAGIVSGVFGFDQFGMAVDIGANYRLLPQLLLSASVLDIGGITWNNTFEGTFDFEWDYSGIELNPFSGIDTSFVSVLMDSLSNAYGFSTGDPYISPLNPKLFLGASFYPVEKIGFGFVSRTDFLNEKVAQQFTGSVNMTTGKFANLTLSYSYIAQKLNNIGAGFSFNVGPFNWYMISDNVISTALRPTKARSMNLWFGLNLTFGWKKVKKAHSKEEKMKKIDKPLVL